MPKEQDVKETQFYVCPNNCKDTYFYQEGVLEAVRKLTEEGEVIEDENYDFIPKGPIKCRKCDAKPIIKKKKTIIKTTIE